LINGIFGKVDMEKKKKETIYNVILLAMIIVLFLIINIVLGNTNKRYSMFVSDGARYCYGIDSLEKTDDVYTLKGWFLELRSVQKVVQEVSDEDAELMLAFVPLGEDKVSTETSNGIFLKVNEMKIERPDINKYFDCEYDYSRCGFTATIDADELDLETTKYRLVFKPDSDNKKAILSNIYVSQKGIMYVNPEKTPSLDLDGTDLEKIVNEGVCLASNPDVGCYVYQNGDKLYWIADKGFAFDKNGRTYIEYMLDTTQVDKLPAERVENNWFWSNIGGCFEEYEITDKINTGKYRVMMREIPDEYSVTYIITGCYRDGWIWKFEFKPDYTMLKK